MPALLAILTPTTMLVVGGVMLLLFGNRLPSVMRSLGEGITEFKKGMNGEPEGDDLNREPHAKLDPPRDSAPAPKVETHDAAK